MIDLTQGSGFRNLVNGIHVSLGANFVLLASAFGHVQIGVLMCVAYGLVKEFVFDILFETPETSGGFLGGVKDFVGYIAGAALACALLKFA